MKSLQIERILGKARNRVYRVGVELEGGWRRLSPGVSLARDGSVKIPPEYVAVQDIQPDGTFLKLVRIAIGELQSEPLPVEKLAGWVKQYYPHRVNETCGLHVHMSFASARHYQMLMVPEFQATILKYVKRWAKVEALEPDHPIWARLSGEYEHCTNHFWPDLQAKANNKDYDKLREGNRYTAINYCFNMNSTIECRLLPMMDTPALGIRAIQQVIDITNASLVVLAEREEKVSAQVLDNGDTEEEGACVYV